MYRGGQYDIVGPIYDRCSFRRGAYGREWVAPQIGFRLNGVERRVDRGARWMLASDYVRASSRDFSKVVTIQDIIGFRCGCEWCR